MITRTIVAVTADRSLIAELAGASTRANVRVVETTCDPERAVDAGILFDPDVVLVDLSSTEPRTVMRLVSALEATLGIPCVYVNRRHVSAHSVAAGHLRGVYLARPIGYHDLRDKIERAAHRASGRGLAAVMDEFENLDAHEFRPRRDPGVAG